MTPRVRNAPRGGRPGRGVVIVVRDAAAGPGGREYRTVSAWTRTTDASAPPSSGSRTGPCSSAGSSPTSRPAALAEVQRLPPKPAPRARGRATCATSRGARSTTTTRSTSTSSRWREPAATAARSGCWSPIADVDALVGEGHGGRRSRPDQHDLGLHGGRDLPDAARAALDRPHLARRPPGPPRGRGRDDGRRRRRRSPAPTSTGRSVTTTPSSPTTRSPPGSRATGPVPPALAAVPGLDDSLRLQDEVAQQLRALAARARRARPRDDRGAAGVRRRRRSTDLADEETNRAKELIEDFMIAANGVTARFLEAKGLPVAAPGRADPEALGAHRRGSAAELGEQLPATARRAGARALPGQAPGRRPAALPRPLADRGQAARRRRVRRRRAGRRRARPLRPRGAGTTPTRRRPTAASRTSSRSASSRPRWPARRRPTRTTSSRSWPPTARRRRTPPTRSSARSRSRPRRCCWPGRSGRRFDAIVTGASAKGTWVRIFRPPVEGKVVEGSTGARRRRAGSACSLVHTDVERGFIDFER